MAMMRYPGSKTKISMPIMRRFPEHMKYPLWSEASPWEYREPFFGAGAVGVQVLRDISAQCSVWINDFDPHVVSLWRAIAEHPKGLIERIYELVPTVDLFFQLKEEDGRTDIDDVEAGARKLILHAMSRSGFGVKAGGPIGGKNQDNPTYDIACRWRPEEREKEIRRLYKRFKRFDSLKITNLDFEALIRDAPADCFIYADPPYVKAGPALYKHSLDDAGHHRLAEALRYCQASWVLSYDDHPMIRDLYSWAIIEPIFITYTVARTDGPTRPKNQEVIITPPECRG